MWTARTRLRESCQRLQTWHRQSEQYAAVRAELADLHSPNIGEVTCVSPGSLGKLRANVRIMGYLLPLAVGLGILLRVATWYAVRRLCCVCFTSCHTAGTATRRWRSLRPRVHILLPRYTRRARRLAIPSKAVRTKQTATLLRRLQLRGELVHGGDVVERRKIGVSGEGVALCSVHKNLHL